jgi:hypothetical protein
LRDALVKRHRTVRRPATVIVPVESCAPATVKRRVLIDIAALQTRDGDQRLKRGTGGELRLDCAVEQRIARIFG